MKAESRVCDVCLSEVDLYWPLTVGAGQAASPTGEFLEADFCSLEHLNQWLAALTAQVST